MIAVVYLYINDFLFTCYFFFPSFNIPHSQCYMLMDKLSKFRLYMCTLKTHNVQHSRNKQCRLSNRALYVPSFIVEVRQKRNYSFINLDQFIDLLKRMLLYLLSILDTHKPYVLQSHMK